MLYTITSKNFLDVIIIFTANKSKEGYHLDKNFQQLADKIEQKRQILHEQMNFYQDLSHPIIIMLSQELDDLLNQMNRIYKQQAI